MGNGMEGFIDIHTHILPGVDDGSKTLESSLQMLSDACRDGTKAVILTPHYKQGYRHSSAEEIRGKFFEFKAQAVGRVPISLYLGTEVLYEIDLPQKLLDGKVLTMADTAAVLVEFLPTAQYDYLSNGIFDLIRYGYTPVIAHAERYRCLNCDRLSELVRMGAKIQFNAGSVLGRSGFSVKRFCREAIKTGLVSFLASDAHDPGLRTAQLARCAEDVRKRHGAEAVNRLFASNARTLFGIND